MIKEDITKELDSIGVSYDGRWNEEKLSGLLTQARSAQVEEPVAAEPEIVEEKAPEYTDEQISNIAASVSGKNQLTTDELSETVGLHKELGGELKTRSGILIPTKAAMALGKTQYVWIAKETTAGIEIYKINKAKRETFVRIYNLADHGENYKQMATGFVEKRNRLGK